MRPWKIRYCLILHALFSDCCDEDVGGASGIFVMVIRCYYQTGVCDVKVICQRLHLSYWGWKEACLIQVMYVMSMTAGAVTIGGGLREMGITSVPLRRQ